MEVIVAIRAMSSRVSPPSSRQMATIASYAFWYAVALFNVVAGCARAAAPGVVACRPPPTGACRRLRQWSQSCRPPGLHFARGVPSCESGPMIDLLVLPRRAVPRTVGGHAVLLQAPPHLRFLEVEHGQPGGDVEVRRA